MADVRASAGEPAAARGAVATAEPLVPQPRGTEAHALLRRAPMAYLWNQIGSMWLYVATFLLALVAARTLGAARYGVYAVALTAFNTAVYLAAFGLEDAATIYIPKTVAERGLDAAAPLLRRLLVARTVCVVIVCVALYWLAPALSTWFRLQAFPGARFLADALHVPGFNDLALPLVAYVAGSGIFNMLGTIFTAILRTRLTLIVGGLAQLANVAGVLIAGKLGGGVAGVIWALAIVAWLASAAYLAVLFPVLRRPPLAPDPFAPVLRLGWTAWLTNLVSGALLKQAAVALLQWAVVSVAAIGYFNLAFQSSHAAALLLVAGLGGVGMAVMSAAEAGAGRRGLGIAWRTVTKLQILLAVPLLAFTFANASSIARILYGSNYAPAVGPLMQLFLVFNVLQRLAGGGAHQAALYVLGRQRWAFLAQWLGFLATLILGAALVRGGPFAGAPGALIAVGAGQVGAELLQLAFVWRFVGSAYPLRFAARLCAAVLLPVVVGVLWPADALLAARLSLGPLAIPPALVSVTASGIVFGALLLVGLYVAKPVEDGDVALLANVNPRFRPLLAPFTSTAKPQPE